MSSLPRQPQVDDHHRSHEPDAPSSSQDQNVVAGDPGSVATNKRKVEMNEVLREGIAAFLEVGEMDYDAAKYTEELRMENTVLIAMNKVLEEENTRLLEENEAIKTKVAVAKSLIHELLDLIHQLD